MSYGLLRGAFRPGDAVYALRVLVRQRAASLQGSWRAEHLFAVKQALAAFDFCGSQPAEGDAEIEHQGC